MKTLFSAIVLVLLLVVPGTASAQLGFGGGFVLGLATGDSNSIAMMNGTTIYLMPNASERVKNPLMVRMAATSDRTFSVEPSFNYATALLGVPLWEIFKGVVVDSEKFEIIRIDRVIGFGNASAAIWFMYLEKQYVAPLPLKNAEKK